MFIFIIKHTRIKGQYAAIAVNRGIFIINICRIGSKFIGDDLGLGCDRQARIWITPRDIIGIGGDKGKAFLCRGTCCLFVDFRVSIIAIRALDDKIGGRFARHILRDLTLATTIGCAYRFTRFIGGHCYGKCIIIQILIGAIVTARDREGSQNKLVRGQTQSVSNAFYRIVVPISYQLKFMIPNPQIGQSSVIKRHISISDCTFGFAITGIEFAAANLNNKREITTRYRARNRRCLVKIKQTSIISKRFSVTIVGITIL